MSLSIYRIKNMDTFGKTELIRNETISIDLKVLIAIMLTSTLTYISYTLEFTRNSFHNSLYLFLKIVIDKFIMNIRFHFICFENTRSAQNKR